MAKKTNRIAKIMQIIGCFVIIAGIISALICGDIFEKLEYNWTVAVSGILGSVLVGAFYIALSEIIELLETIKEKLATKENNSQNPVSKKVKTQRYRCAKCGYEGDYGTNCPSCNSTSKYYLYDDE